MEHTEVTSNVAEEGQMGSQGQSYWRTVIRDYKGHGSRGSGRILRLGDVCWWERSRETMSSLSMCHWDRALI